MKLIAVALIAGLVVRLLPCRNGYMTEDAEERLLDKIPNGHYEDVCEYVNEHSDPEFWIATKGLKGVLERVRIAHVYLRLIHVLRHKKTLDLEDAMSLWWLLAQQLLFSLLAVPEAVVRHKHNTARRALQTYCEMIRTTHIVFSSYSGNLCPIRLANLL